MRKPKEFCVKLERVRAFMSENRLAGLVLSRADNFAWLGCGADSTVDLSNPIGVGTLVVRRKDVALVANNIEVDRLVAEELQGLELDEVGTYRWYEPRRRNEIIRKLVGRGTFASDDGTPRLRVIPDGFVQLRYELTSAEIERYRELGRGSCEAMEAAARHAEKGMSERRVASLISEEYRQRGIATIVLLVAADDRIERWRHPIVREKEIEQCVMIVCCGRRWGLVTAMTRLVHFGAPSDALKQKHQAVCEVDASMIVATKVGRTGAEIFREAQAAYERVGFPDEWQLHHQGGAIGYLPREYKIGPSCQEKVRRRQGFAWNPSIAGTKSEDTVLVFSREVEVLTGASRFWPTLSVELDGQTIERPDILIK